MIITTITRKISEGERIALGELSAMLPFFLICNGLVLVFSGIYGLAGGNIGFGIFTGLLLGNIVGAFNFYLIGLSSGKLLRKGKKSEAGVRSFAGVMYGLRYFIMFAVYWILASLELINIFTSLLPLLYPSFYYKFMAFFNKSV
ncbi:MAG: hypothetical protein FWG70_08835 [Oscillospiraceae bacterium]|nr:hypothetical protein [Oscillospiraceae bacterium]